MPTGRFAAYPYPDALYVLDTQTGEIVRVPLDGGPESTLRRGVQVASLDGSGSGGNPPPAPTPGDAFDREIIATYPFPIAHAYQAFLGERDPRQRARLLIDTFAIALKTWALMLVTQYLSSDSPGDALLDDLLGRELRRPLISTWDQAIQRSLSAFKDQGTVLFAPELHKAYEGLETRCRDPFLATISYEDEDGQPREKRSRLGKVRALLRYRNSLAHGFVQQAGQALADLALYEPLLRDVLRAGEFLRRYALYSADQVAGRGQVSARRWMGAEVANDVWTIDAPHLDLATSPFFFRNEATEAVLPLFAFADIERDDSTGHEELLLYDGFSRGAVVYVSSSGQRVERAKRASQLAAMLDQRVAPTAVLTSDRITREGLVAAATRVTSMTLERLRAAGRPVTDLVRPRPQIEETLASFREGDERGLVILGESGSGKTTVAATFARERVAAGDVVVFLRGQDVADADLDLKVLRSVSTRGMHFEDFLAGASAAFAEGGHRFYVIVDGMNETPADLAAVLRSFDGIVAQADTFPWFRAVATVRARAYERVASRARVGHDPRARYVRFDGANGAKELFTTLNPLSVAEVGEFYEAYRAHRVEPSDSDAIGGYRARPVTPFADLDPLGSTVALMRNPLMLRVVVTAYHGKRLPPELRFDEAMDLYVEKVIVEEGSAGGPHRERRHLLDTLVRALDGASATSLPLEQLYDVPALKRALENPERDSPYVQLIDLGVLVESWEGRICRVQFGFDRLFEDQLARLHEPRLVEPSDVAALALRATSYASLRGALAILLARSTHHGRAGLAVEALRVARTTCKDAEAVIVAAIVDALYVLARSRDPAMPELLASIQLDTTTASVRLLVEVIDRLTRVSEVQGMDRLLDVAVELADATGDPAARAEVALRWAMLLQHRGEWSLALTHLERARENAVAAGDEALEMRSALLSGEIFRAMGVMAKASEIFDRASRWFTEHGELPRAAEARRQQAIIEGARGGLEARRKLVTLAVELARASKDREAELRCYTSLGQTHRLLGESAGAVQWFGEALAAAEAVGNARLIANALNNLGVALREGRDRSRAGALFTRAADLLERMGDKKWLPGALHNLALTEMDVGRLDEAIALSERSISLYARSGEQADIIEAKNLLGALLAARGDRGRARAVLVDALTIARRTGHTAGTQNALFQVGCLDAAAGRIAEARRAALELDELRAKEPSPLSELTSASLWVVLSALDATSTALPSATEALRRSRDRVTSMQDVHAGPAVAWLAAARRSKDDGATSIAEACVDELRRELDGRWFPGASDLTGPSP